MSGTCVVLAVKPFNDAKERLATGLDPAARRRIAEAMVQDVLAALTRCSAVDHVVLVTTEPSLAEAPVDAVLADPAIGHSEAATVGANWAIEHGCDMVAMIPGDCPLLDSAELDALLLRCREQNIDVAVVPDRMGTGTNALVLTPPDAITPAFGPDSRERHTALATAAGRRTEMIEVPTLALDLDTADDLAELAERIAAGSHQAINTEQVVGELMTNRFGLPGGFAR
jgi:2-phospho-L-lactate guanylyltransferase